MPDRVGEAAAPRGPASPWELFTTFTVLALQGFGGVLAVAQRELCDRRGWLTPAEFVEILSIGQVLPGPNVCNLSLMVGDRFFGWRGAFAALAGMTALPLLIVLVLAALLGGGGVHPLVDGALHGMGLTVSGLIGGTALRLAAPLRHSAMGRLACAAAAGLTFMLIVFVRLPLVWVLAGVGLPAIAWAGWQLTRQAQAQARARAPGTAGQED